MTVREDRSLVGNLPAVARDAAGPLPRINLFGIDIHPLPTEQVVAEILAWIGQRRGACRMIVTPNVNHAVLYQRDADFRNAYGRATYRLPDGRYLDYCARLLGLGRLPAVNGSDLVPALFAAGRRLRIFLLGAGPGVAECAAAQIERRYPWVTVGGTASPAPGFEADPAASEALLRRIRGASVDLLVVGISPPRQEIWVARRLEQIQASVVICAGATIDFLAGQRRRAPRWMQRSGLEWLFRAGNEPIRLLPRYTRDAWQLGSMLWRERKRCIGGCIGVDQPRDRMGGDQ